MDIFQISACAAMAALSVGAAVSCTVRIMGLEYRQRRLEEEIRNAGRRRSQCYIYSAVGRIESRSCGGGLVEYRDKVTDFVPEFSDNKNTL